MTATEELAVSISKLGKRYRLGETSRHGGAQYGTLRDSIASLASAPWRKLKATFRSVSPASNDEDSLWALRDLTFDVREREVVGIIGRNGAGKSTLLKILSRITEPTEGRVLLRGRVASLLEVGTGFHPELTGRENIFLNGAILGMRKAEIEAKFDEIVAFSELERFLDTPVKRYSSGMVVRLAFSVAAHLEPEILVVDEVLAVGDLGFQEKCLGVMRNLPSANRTVIFVTHNMAAAAGLCKRGLLLRQGRLVFDGSIDKCIETYVESLSSEVPGEGDLQGRTDRSGNGRIRFTRIEYFVGSERIASQNGITGLPLEIRLHFSKEPEFSPKRVRFAVAFLDSFHRFAARVDSDLTDDHFADVPSGGSVTCTIPRLTLGPGRYTLELGVGTGGGNICDLLPQGAVLNIEAGDFFGTGRLPPEGQRAFFIDHAWRLDGADAAQETLGLASTGKSPSTP